MPFSVRRDVAGAFSLGNPPYRLSSVAGLSPPPGGSARALETLRPRAAEARWDVFARDALAEMAASPTRIKRELARLQAKRYNYREVADADACFDALWKLVKVGRGIAGRRAYQDEVEADLEQAYRMAATLAAGAPLPAFPDAPTLSRVVERDDERFVVFSDHHLTHFSSIPNYFAEHNLNLYLDVLVHYRDRPGAFCLVENGDVEDYTIFEPDAATAQAWWDTAKWNDADADEHFGRPIERDDPGWQGFLALRYLKRAETLDAILDRFEPYYELVQAGFVDTDRYVRLSGNHDTYLDLPFEQDLLATLQGRLGADVHDVLRIRDARSQVISHLVLHGHQFDRVCLQHGKTPFAITFGEVFSECISWGYQGPDRFWDASDAKRWHVRDVPNAFANRVAYADPQPLSTPTGIDDFLHLAFGPARAAGAGTVEHLLKHEVAWEYFENDNVIDALVLEVLSGNETWKFRHMNERALCDGYVAAFGEASGRDTPPDEIPRLVLGHTHEVRHLPTDERGSAYPNGAVCVNDGSAGRFEGLIWCVEIEHGLERVCSWSRDRGRLKKVTWASDGAGVLVPSAIEHV